MVLLAKREGGSSARPTSLLSEWLSTNITHAPTWAKCMPFPLRRLASLEAEGLEPEGWSVTLKLSQAAL